MQKLAFDIGCNIGNYSRKLLENGWNVVSVDPNPYIFTDIPKNIIRIIAACSNSVGHVPFFFSNANTISTASKDWVEKSRFAGKYTWEKFEVSSTTIDELVKIFGCPKHIKIDVEGYEFTAMKGMTKKYADELCFEWAEEEGDSAVECVKYLSTLGYTIFGHILCDDYLVEPENYYNLETFLNNFKYDKNRKELWGMIWAK